MAARKPRRALESVQGKEVERVETKDGLVPIRCGSVVFGYTVVYGVGVFVSYGSGICGVVLLGESLIVRRAGHMHRFSPDRKVVCWEIRKGD